MYVLDQSWQNDFLDYTLATGQTSIVVSVWQSLGAIDQAFIQRERDWRLVYNYLREIGPREVWRKVKSRSAERLRNEKYVSCGLGEVLESASGTFAQGESVVFLAPFHP